MSKFNIFIIFLLILVILFLSGCTCKIFEWQKTRLEDLPGKSGTVSQETINPDNSKTSFDEEKDSTDDPIKEPGTSEDASNDQEDDNSASVEGNIEKPLASQRYAVIISGASYDRQHYKWFLDSTYMAYKLLKNNGYIDENIYYLFENSKEPSVDHEATIDNFRKIVGELESKTGDEDNIVLFLIGHGSYHDTGSFYSLNDYDLSGIELAEMFKNIKRDKVVFVFSPCSSGGFIDNLSGENNIVITSTRKDESNRAAFIEPFLTSFGGAGDADKDGKVSFAEAFNFACKNVEEQFINNGWDSLTEHAQLDDNGDKMSHEYPIPEGGDGLLAEDIYLSDFFTAN